jgi:hypothetical protein
LYESEYSYFNISEVVSVSDWRLREDYVGIQGAWQSTSSYEAVAMSFTIEEEYANITAVRLNYAVENSPSGEVYLVNSSGGKPDVRSNNISSIEPMTTSSGWKTHTFKKSILLEKGQTYYVVMNATSYDGTHYWYWRHNIDNEYKTDIGLVHRYVGGLGWTNSIDFEDLPLQIRLLPVEGVNGEFVNITYTDPYSLEFSYNTTLDNTSLSSYVWFLANDTETHKFTTNTSVTFKLDFLANYTYSSNPINGVTSYLTQNNTDSFWNVTFSTKDVNNTYNVKNRTISISGLQSDWNGWEVYWNDSSSPIYSDLDGDSAINYSNGSSTMVINISTTWQNQTWNISFSAPNYLYDFNISRGGTLLDLPYETYTMNDYSLDFEIVETGNITYWIDYPNSSQLLKKDFNRTHTTINDLWDINSTFDNIVEVNGTYNLQAFWNNSDSTKVGTFTRTY